MTDIESAPLNVANTPAGTTCAECATFAHGWVGTDWRCRRAARNVNKHSDACDLWHPRRPEPEPDMEAMRPAAAALDRIMAGIVPTWEPTEITPRKRPPGLRGHSGGVVYFIDCGPMTKVGYTSSLIEDRIKGIATHNPFDLTLWALVAGDMRFEREWHSYLAKYRYRNEWFRLTAEARDDIKRLISEHGGELYE